jgi:endonuclease/exonuclease/phosphatase (EEP) superfamily protein YafD
VKSVYYAYKKSAKAKKRQLSVVSQAIENSPYPVLACGDLNYTPYSRPYARLKENLYNSFESAGRGFGFTLNIDKLFFLRIDNQFYSPELEASNHRVLRNYKWSDHFPVSCYYKAI